MFNFFDDLKKEFKLQPSVFSAFNLVMVSTSLVYLEGHKGLLKLSDENVTLRVKKGVVCIMGKNLKISEMTQKTIAISGEISKVEVL